MRTANDSVGIGLFAAAVLMTVGTFGYLVYDAATTKLTTVNHRTVSVTTAQEEKEATAH